MSINIVKRLVLFYIYYRLVFIYMIGDNMNDGPSMKLNELLNQYQNIDDEKERIKQQRNVVFCIDQALQDMNKQGFCVDSFDPHDITVFPNKIVFDDTSKISGDKDSIVRRNIFDAALLSIRIYLNYFDDIEEMHENIDKLFSKSIEVLGDV